MTGWVAKPGVFALSILLVFSVAGCRTIKAPVSPERVWEAPKQEKAASKADPVWKKLRVGEVDARRIYTLPELVDVALANNPSTRQTWQEARAAFFMKKQAESGWYPQLTATGNFTRDKKHGEPGSDNLNTRNYGGVLKAEMLVFNFGGREASVREANQTLIEANFLFNQSIQDLILDVKTAYYNLYSAKSLVMAAEADANDARVSYETAEQKFRVGLAMKLDVLQAKSTYEEKLYNLEDAKGNLKTAEGDLARVLGLPADVGILTDDPSEEVPVEITDADVSYVIGEAIARRPDIAAERASLKSKEEAVTAQAAELWPELNVAGSADREWYEYFGDDKAGKQYYDMKAYMTVDWNVFDGFDNYSKVKEAVAVARAEKEKLRAAELAASADVWTKFYAFRTSVRKLAYGKSFLNTATEAHHLAMQGYNAGLKDILDLLKAQSDLSNARSKLIQSEKDVYTTLAELAHATGLLGAEGEQ